MKLHPLFVAVGFALLATSCGVSRDADVADSTDDPTEAAEQATGEDAEDAEGAEGDTTDEEDGEVVPEAVEAAPVTTAPPEEVAATVTFAGGDSVEILHGDLNEIVVDTQENQEFIDLVYGGQTPPGFNSILLSQDILGRAIDNELASLGTEASDADEAEALDLLIQQLEGLMLEAEDPAADAERLYEEVPYLQFIVALQARQVSLSNYLTENAEDVDGSPCVRHILVETEPEADTILTDLDGGADFGELAMELSTGPSGPTGGDLGCAPTANYVPEFAEAVDSAEIAEYVKVQSEFGWHVLVVDGFEVDGATIAQDTLAAALEEAEVEVDERIGTWDVSRLTVVAAG